ncbi:hypothetical protein AAC387_Pa04g1762 [Persea americana]
MKWVGYGECCRDNGRLLSSDGLVGGKGKMGWPAAQWLLRKEMKWPAERRPGVKWPLAQGEKEWPLLQQVKWPLLQGIDWPVKLDDGRAVQGEKSGCCSRWGPAGQREREE